MSDIASACADLIDTNQTAPKRLGEWHPATAHAKQLRSWLQANGYAGSSLVASDLRELYLRMCAELNWHPTPWNSIARAFALVTTEGHKVYAYVGDRRLRIYPLPRRAENAAADGGDLPPA